MSAPLDALETYRRSQTSILLVTSAAAALLLSAAAFLGSRAIARRIEALSTQAGAIAAGDFHGRVTLKGRDEVGDLAVRVNMIASEVENRMERLRSEKEDRQKFIDSLTHELRTPITSIVGFAEHLRYRAYNEKIFARSLDRIHEEGLRVLSLSDSLKRLLIMRTGAREITRIPVPQFLDRLSIEARERFPERAADIKVQAVSGDLEADPQLLMTALLNLIDNAVRASPDSTPIVIGFCVNDTGRSLYVRDHGPGMSREERARAMEPFSRGPGRTGTGGFGLGLSICREIADYHDARLELESPADGGMLARLVFKNLQ